MTHQIRADSADTLLQLAMQAALVIAYEWDIVNDRVRRLRSVENALPPTESDTFEGVVQAVHPVDREVFRANVAAALESEDGRYRSEHRLLRPDGQVRWMSEVGQVQFDDARRPVRLIGVSQDVTEQKLVEARLRESEGRYQHLLNSIEQGFCLMEMVYDAAGHAVDYRFIETNAAFERHTGLVNVAGRCARELVSGLEQHWIDVYARVAETGTSERFEQGSVAMGRLFSVEAVRVGEPAQHLVALLFSDITERQRYAQTLQESEARFREMADGLPLIVWVHDTQGALEFVNATFCEFFGVSREQMRADRWQALTHPDDGTAYADEFMACSRERRPFHGEVRARAADGQWHWMESWARPWFGPDGGFRGHIGVSADVTDRKAVEAALRDADRSKDEFLATLAHELRNPLAPIYNVAQLIEVSPSPEVVGRASGMLKRQVQHMARLLDDLLDVSRLTLKRLRLQIEKIDLRDVVADALEQSRSQLDGARQTVALDLPDEPVTLSGDRVRLAQVVSNLLTNAARYSAGPGTVTVRVCRRDGEAQLSVRDQGIGIRADALPRVFGMLVQGDADHRSAQGGLGIGLTLVKGLVELHGGSVQAASDGEGRGAEFIVRLPLNASTAVAATAARPELPQTEGGQRILVVDDNVDSAKSMAMLLSALGYDTRTAHNGIDAIRSAESFQPAAVLLDIGLPDISGLEVAQRIRRTDWGRAMRLAALSGWGQDADKQRAMAAGFDQHLTKPADPVQLQQLLERLLDERTGSAR